MIQCIAGEPGGGKSYWGVEMAMDHMAKGGVVVTNLPIRGVVTNDLPGLDKYTFPSSAPFVDWLYTFRKWHYQPGQLRYLDQEMISGNWISLIPKGTPKKHVLFVFDESGDQFDSLDTGRLKDKKDDYYRKLFEFLRLHRHYYVDVILLLQDFSTMNARLRGLSTYVHKTVDMEGRRIAGIFFKCPVPVFCRFTFDKSARTLLKKVYVTKCISVYKIYDSYNDHGGFALAQGVEVDFQNVGKVERKVKKMTWFDRALLVACVVAMLCVVGFKGSGRGGGASGSSGVEVSRVVVTNTVTVVPDKQVAVSVYAPPSVTVEYAPISYHSAGAGEQWADTWAYAGGKLYRAGMVLPAGRVVQLEKWGIRIVGDSGEKWIYHCETPRNDSGIRAKPEFVQTGNENAVSDSGVVSAL